MTDKQLIKEYSWIIGTGIVDMSHFPAITSERVEAAQNRVDKLKYKFVRPNFAQFKYINAAEAEIMLDLKPSEKHEHVIKLLNACGVEPHPVQHLSQGVGLKLQYKREEVLKKCIVSFSEYVKKDIKKA